jgi:hypothetical protein
MKYFADVIRFVPKEPEIRYLSQISLDIPNLCTDYAMLQQELQSAFRPTAKLEAGWNLAWDLVDMQLQECQLKRRR